MFLKRLTIYGFKSFATKTTLELEPGITAIVGPNGSGKSNIADAVRWVLGEQSAKSLRTKKGDEVIFAGTDKRAKASYAEVSLLLDNTKKPLAIDFSEVELARRLYRSGESEYRLNGRKANLRDIQQLLVQAGFGPNSYSVIGQGMIDQLILASPAERKLLFDEASGIRGFEIKREQALRKLEAVNTNRARVEDILGELNPRLVTLERGAKAAQTRQNLTIELADMRRVYIQAAQTDHANRRQATQAALERVAEDIKQHNQIIAGLEADRASVMARPAPELTELTEREARRDQLGNDLIVKRAELQQLQEKQAELLDKQTQALEVERQLAQAKRRRQQLTHHLAAARVEETEATERLAHIGKDIDKAQAKLAALRQQSDQTSRHEYVAHALSILKQASYNLRDETTMKPEEVRLLVYKAGRLLSHASRGQEEVIGELRQIQANLTSAMRLREEAHDPYTNAVIQVRSLELDLAHSEDQIASLSQQLSETKHWAHEYKQTSRLIAERQAHITTLDQSLSQVNEAVQTLRSQAADSAASSQGTTEIFNLAAKLESSKSELAKLEQERRAAQTELKAIESRVDQLTKLSRQWFGAESIESGQGHHLPLEELERGIAVLEARLQETQTTDSEVLEEYDAVSKRYKFLSEQVSDLSNAQADLQKVLAELDKLIGRKFEAAFADMGHQFSRYFEQLFGGGKAGLALKPDANGTYGIEIKAVPPGKRVESLATLSGGERALTGVALLAAIMTINPSPFVMLDEIDAALDEANSSRLSQILADLTKHSQLIAITHNRQIMTAAKVLYGVTMDTHQVSKVLSIRLETASQQAAHK